MPGMQLDPSGLSWRGVRLADVRLFQPFQLSAPSDGPFLIGRVMAESKAFAPSPLANGRRIVQGASSGTNPEQIRLRAFGELIERGSGQLSQLDPEHAPVPFGSIDPKESFVDLEQLGISADPASLRWNAGRDVITGKTVWLPGAMIFVPYRPLAGEPVPFRAGSAGLAAHSSFESAALHGLLEVIERHAWILS